MSKNTLATRLQYYGEDPLTRINRQKRHSLHMSLKNDYNSRLIKTPAKNTCYALINTNNLKPDYDKKIISVDFDSRLEAGDVFEVLDDHSMWMVYLPILTETAYLRAEIIRCRYTLEVEGEKYWVYFQGPTETDLRWYIKSGTNFNELNLSGTIYIKNTPQTRNHFKRFTHLSINGHTWEVQVTDSISVPGVLELEIQEYYDPVVSDLPEIIKEDNETEDMIGPKIVGRAVVQQEEIVGYGIDDQYMNSSYSWKILNNERVRVVSVDRNGKFCKVKIHDGAIGNFIIEYGPHQLQVEIDSKEQIIKGPTKVYPYDKHEYWVETDKQCHFRVNNDLAKIISQTSNSCQVFISSSKKGNFILECDVEEYEQDTSNDNELIEVLSEEELPVEPDEGSGEGEIEIPDDEIIEEEPSEDEEEEKTFVTFTLPIRILSF